MQYVERITYYRKEFERSVMAGDVHSATQSALAYANVLREMANLLEAGTKKRTYLMREAAFYEKLASCISPDGVNEKEAVLSSKSYEEKEWVADVFEARIAATLMVKSSGVVGTGFFISADGLLLTNYHVVGQVSGLDSRVFIESGDGKINREASVLATDKKRDLALLKVSLGEQKTAFIPFVEHYDELRPGEEVVVIGNAFSLGLAPITGTVKFTHARESNDLIYTAPSNHGDSGGPVLNRKGECVGINKSITVSITRGGQTVNAQGLTNATPADEIKHILGTWKKQFKL